MEKSSSIRVAWYIRVSTADQTEKYGPDLQRAELDAHTKRNEYKGWHTKKEWQFVEQGSGKSTKNRPEFNRMMELARKKEFDLVLVYKIDRISRSLTDLLQTFETLEKNDVSFASVKEDIDFTGPVGKMIFQIFGSIAEFERETIKMRTGEGKLASARADNYIGGSIPYGYEKIPNNSGRGSTIKLIANEAKIVEQVFRWFVSDGLTYQEIASKLNEMGVQKGKSLRTDAQMTPWRDRTVIDMLRNEVYRGVYITNRTRRFSDKPRKEIELPREEWIINPVDPAISAGLFIAAQERMQILAKKRRSGGGKEVYMLAGKLLDTNTGKGFIGYVSSKKTKNYRRKQFTDQNGVYHASISISALEMDGFVWSHLERALNQPKLFLDLHKSGKQTAKKLKSLEAELKITEKMLSDANRRLKKVQDDYFREEIEATVRDEWLDTYTEQRDGAMKETKRVEEEIKRINNYEQACKELEVFARGLKEDASKFSYKEKKDYAEMLVEQVKIKDVKGKREAIVSFRFDPKAIAASIPTGRTILAHTQAKEALSAVRKDGRGGRGRT